MSEFRSEIEMMMQFFSIFSANYTNFMIDSVKNVNIKIGERKWHGEVTITWSCFELDSTPNILIEHRP